MRASAAREPASPGAPAWPRPLPSTHEPPGAAALPLERVVARLCALLAPHVRARPVAVWRLPPRAALPLFFALARLRAAPVFLNDRWTPADAAAALRAAPCAAVVTADVAAAARAAARCDDAPAVLELFERDAAFVVTPFARGGAPRPAPPPHPPRDVAAVFFTSGTTAAPKPVPLTRANLTVQARAKIAHLPLTPDVVYLHLAPLYHLGGFSSSLAVTLAGGTHVFPPTRSPSDPAHARDLLRLVRRRAVTLLVVVPALLRLLLDAASQSCPSVQVVLYGGSAATPMLLADAHRAFPNARIMGTYAMTETASTLTLMRHSRESQAPLAPTCVGRPLEHVQLAIRAGDGSAVTDGAVGEVVTRGPHVTPGYLSLPPDRSFTPDGWFRTGDLGYLQDGALHLVGRKNDIIRSGGESVFAGEVEKALVAHPHVRDAAVVGLPHRVLGEAVAAAVELAKGVKVGETIAALEAFCKEVLAGFKRPKWILPAGELPRNGTGKIVKTRVREILEKSIRPTARL